MRKIQIKLWRSAAAASIALVLLIGVPASAQYVDYFTVNGEWSVTCARDFLATQATCNLSAPQLRLGQPSTAVLTISAPAGTSPVVSFRLPGVVNATRTVSATVDNAPAVESQTNRYGEGHWTGAAGASLIQSMRVGNTLRLNWWLDGESAPRTAIIGLARFAQALDDFRKRVTAIGASP